MVLPITGPFTTVKSSYWDSEVKTWYRQKPPFTRALAFNLSRGGMVTARNPGDPAVDSAYWRLWAESLHASDRSATYVKAYERFVDQLGDPASLGLNLVQWKQADEMIKKRGGQLLSFNNALLRRSPLGIARSLGMSLRDVRRLVGTRHGFSRKLSDLWLEFWFGWKPMVSDIYTACEVFERDLPWERIKSSSKIVWKGDVVSWSGNPTSRKTVVDRTSRCRLGAYVRIENPNLRLLQQFGLLNPLEVLWDAIPWSFVLGWFGNVNAYLASLTDFAGLAISDGYRSHSTVIDQGFTSWPAYPDKGGQGFGSCVSRELVTSFEAPRLTFSLKRWQPERGLTAMSLLVQKLPKS